MAFSHSSEVSARNPFSPYLINFSLPAKEEETEGIER